METENLKIIKNRKLTLNIRKRIKKEENDQQTGNLQFFLEPETDPKNEETDPKKKKLINKLRV